MKTRILTILSVCAALPVAAVAEEAALQDMLSACVSDLRENPADTALRERIIRLAQEMDPPPAIPEEARRHFDRASALLADAKPPADGAGAADEFRQALLVAPWWAEAYMSLGLALETAGRPDDAIASFRLFLATHPQGEALRSAQDAVARNEAKAEKAVRDRVLAAGRASAELKARQEAVKAGRAKGPGEFPESIDGARYAFRYSGTVALTGAAVDYVDTLDVRGNTATEGSGIAGSTWHPAEGVLIRIEGRTLRWYVNGKLVPQLRGVISRDGSTLTCVNSDTGATNVYTRER
jgi:tetratricopeptide (TPR) repeat protein